MDEMSIPFCAETYGYWRADTEAERHRLMCVFGERLRRSDACNCKRDIRIASHKKSEKLTPGCSMITIASWLQTSLLNKIDSRRELGSESWEGNDSRA